MSPEQQIVFYGRFRLPGRPEDFGGRAVWGWDLFRDAKVLAYASPLNRSKYQSDVVTARRIREEMAGRPGIESDVEIFTTPGWLWVIAPGMREAELAIRKLGEAGLAVAVRPPAAETRSASPSGSIPVPICQVCGSHAATAGQLCDVCKERDSPPNRSAEAAGPRRSGGRVLLVVLVVLALTGLLVYAFIAGQRRSAAPSSTTTLEARRLKYFPTQALFGLSLS